MAFSMQPSQFVFAVCSGTFALVLTETKVINYREAPWWDPKKQNKLFWSLTIHLGDTRTMGTKPVEVNKLICQSYSTSSRNREKPNLEPRSNVLKILYRQCFRCI